MKVFDLHVHSTKGSSDSLLSPVELLGEAERIGLSGICVTEHNSIWDRFSWEALTNQTDLVIIRGMEVETDLGHIVVFGLDSYVSGIHRARELRRIADEVGGFLIVVHPFRAFFEKTSFMQGNRLSHTPTVEEAARLP